VPRAKQRTPELREHVLAVALALLGGEGVAAFTARRVALEAGTSTPAVYELFGDKGGLLREVFYEGFRLLRRQLDTLADSDDPRADLIALVASYRAFVHTNPVLSEVMFSRPFSDFEPGDTEFEASSSVRAFIVERVRRCVEVGVLDGDPVDIAHVLVALVQGLAAAERAGRLGSSQGSIDRRWLLATEAMLGGLHKGS
jgi:AcrR family transcriptional regulator